MDANPAPMPDADRDDESGRYRTTYADADFLEALDVEGGMAGTQDVTDRVGCSYELAYKRLVALEDAGHVSSRKVGNARLWLLEGQ
ncbi:ArsR family transcriptional regulator [Natronosalvus caseinilyticus]|uniref:ArsR family transcriptional regulator n=1 Tax=Natronosalvus caseinilyticus TaxID=2953747 RepID=UPI0028AB8C68|nr:ArsR family transcriptional regulator [Natronosalvus caseinilyticus]